MTPMAVTRRGKVARLPKRSNMMDECIERQVSENNVFNVWCTKASGLCALLADLDAHFAKRGA